MQRLILIFFIASELCYYLLIAQTGIVEYFSSNIFLIAPLPVGGVIGSLLISYIKIKNKISLFLNLDMAFCYQELSIARLCLSDMFLFASRFLYFRNKIYICKYESG